MKKYQQLLIVSLGLVSFICFLIYKHEYDRLRNVLEVLEVFGSPPAPNNDRGGHPLQINHNPALGVGSINELNLPGNQQQQPVYDAKQENFVLKNGHGVRPPDTDDGAKQRLQNGDSGEVVGNMIDDGGGLDTFGGLKMAKKVQRLPQQDSIFREKKQIGKENNL